MKITASCFGFCLLFLLLIPIGVHAQALNTGLGAVGTAAGLPTTTLPQIIGRIIQVILGIVGTVLLVIIMYAGYLWMTAGGDPKNVDKAKDWMRNGVIGFAIVVFSYSITTFIISRLVGGMLGTGGGYVGGGTAPNASLSGGAFGTVIQSQYPMPEQVNVARNTMILVTFRIPINPSSVVDTTNAALCPAGLGAGQICGALKDSFQVYRCAENVLNDCKEIPADAALKIPGYAIVNEDHRTVMFNPYGDVTASDNTVAYLGSADKNMPYIVRLTGSITRDGGTGSIFSVSNPEYRWRFETGRSIDTIPPQVRSVVPAKDLVFPDKGNRNLDDNGFVFLNQVIIVNFNEPVMPVSLEQTCGGGDSDNEAQIINQAKVKDTCNSNHVTGKWQIGVNGYRTIQFKSDTVCAEGAKNSCGEDVFCLPDNSEITGRLLAARSLQGCVGVPGSGVMDMAGNMLDGNEDGNCQGPGAGPALDNFEWHFTTGNQVDLTPPHIVGLHPNNATPNVALDADLGAEFSEDLEPESVDQQVALVGDGFIGWVDPNMGDLPDDGVDLTKIMISHAPFDPAPVGQSLKYTPIVGYLVKDSRQNCFTPTTDETSDCHKDAASGISCCPNMTTFLQEKVGAPTCGLLPAVPGGDGL